MKALDTYALATARALLDRLLIDADAEARSLPGARVLTVEGAAGVLPARLYEPAPDAPPGPGLIYFHGGGFVFCSPATHDALCRRLAAASGLRILSCGYRLAPEHGFPSQHEDALAATRWAFEHATDLKLNPGCIGLAGDSAGAHLAAWAAAKLDPAVGRPALLLLVYPLLALDDAEWSSAPLEDLRILGRTAVAYIRRQLGAHEKVGIDLGSLMEQAPPTVIVSGGLDPVRPDAARFAIQLRAAGAEVTELSFPGLVHGSFNLTHLSEAARRAIVQTGETTAALLSR